MVVSVTLEFMLSIFIRQSERFLKKDQLIWSIFCFGSVGRGILFVCMSA